MMMGFVGWKMVHVVVVVVVVVVGGGGVPVVVAEPEPVEEVMFCSSTINWVGHICWVLGLAGVEAEPS